MEGPAIATLYHVVSLSCLIGIVTYRDNWKSREGLEPLLRHLDGLRALTRRAFRDALLGRASDQLLEVARVDGVDDGVEVVAVRESVLRQLRREVWLELLVILELRPEVADGQLVVAGNRDGDDVLLQEELLLFLEYLAKEVAADLINWRQEELDYIVRSDT